MVAFHPSNTTLATSSYDNIIRMWNAQTGDLIHTLTGHTELIKFIAFNHSGSLLASASADHTVRIWNAHTGDLLHTLTGHTDSIESIAYNPDDTIVATASWDNTTRLWSTLTGDLLHTLTGHIQGANIVSFNHDGTRLATNFSHNACIWNDTRIRPKTQATAQILARALHDRLGQHSPMQLIDSFTIHDIAALARPDSFSKIE
jgi:WD40 repeat protein